MSGGVVSMRDGTAYRLLTVNGVAVVTWLRDGRLCVVSGRGVSGDRLLALASWDGTAARVASSPARRGALPQRTCSGRPAQRTPSARPHRRQRVRQAPAVGRGQLEVQLQRRNHTKRRLSSCSCGSVMRSSASSMSPSSSTSTSIARGPWRTTALAPAQLALDRLDRIEQLQRRQRRLIRTHALRKLGWSSTSPTGSVS